MPKMPLYRCLPSHFTAILLFPVLLSLDLQLDTINNPQSGEETTIELRQENAFIIKLSIIKLSFYSFPSCVSGISDGVFTRGSLFSSSVSGI